MPNISPPSGKPPVPKTAPPKAAPPSTPKAVAEKRNFSEPKVTKEADTPVSSLESQIGDMNTQLEQNLEAARQRMANACESFNDSCEALQAKMKTVDDLSLGDIKAAFAEASRLTDLANQIGEMLE